MSAKGRKFQGGSGHPRIILQWKLEDMLSLLASCERDEATPLMLENLSERCTVLESGCGAARYVKYLSDRGHKVIGLEWSQETVRMTRQVWPDLNIVSGDAASSPFPDATFDVVLSFGVVEHFIEGLGAPLRDIYRVLKPGGRAVITVPCLNGVRRLKRRTWWYEITTAPRALAAWVLRRRPMTLTRRKYRQHAVHPSIGEFFEYRLTTTEFLRELKVVGFNVLRHVPIGHMDGVYHEINPFRMLVRALPGLIFDSCWLARFLDHRLRKYPFLHCHMQGAVVQKPAVDCGMSVLSKR